MIGNAWTLLWSLVLAQPYLALLPLLLVEGPLATVTAGTLVAAGVMSFPLAGLLAVGADLAADTVFFFAGRATRHPRLARVLPRLGLTDTRRGLVELAVRRNLPGVLLGAKVADAAAIPVLLAAGAAGVSYPRFLAWNVAITIPKSLLLLTAGAVFGTQLTRLLTPTSTALVAMAGLAAYLLVIIIRNHRRGRARTAAAA